MKLVQFYGEKHELKAGLLHGDGVETLEVPVANLIRMAGKARVSLPALLAASRPAAKAAEEKNLTYSALEREGRLAPPLLPEEVWGWVRNPISSRSAMIFLMVAGERPKANLFVTILEPTGSG